MIPNHWLIRPVLLLGVLALCSAATQPGTYLREQRSVTVGGVAEAWQLVWEAKPQPICGPDDVEMAMTCPCTGWAYGEMGKLSLVRERGGKEIDRLALGQFFEDLPASKSAGLAAMQWRPFAFGDLERLQGDSSAASPELLTAIRKRKGSRVMDLVDYDHDGVASEFLVQVSAGPCGHSAYVAVGVSKARPRLHALTTARDPGTPLVMPGSAWTALATARRPVAVTRWPCGDHGAEEREELLVGATGGAISVRHRRYTCPEDGSPEKLLGDEPL